MGKPSAPAPPDYAAAAQQQGVANINAAVASNTLNHPNVITPTGSQTWENTGSQTLPDGTKIPQQTMTQSLSPVQQSIFDSQNKISQGMADVSNQGLGYVQNMINSPLRTDNISPIATSAPAGSSYNNARDQLTQSILDRLKPGNDQAQEALNSSLSNQGIQLGSKAWENAQRDFGYKTSADQMGAIAQGDTEQQNLFNQGLANSQFQNNAANQQLQQNEFLRTEPVNMLNAVRTGAQVQMPQFQQYSANANVQAAPIYQAANDSYQAALNSYNASAGGMSGVLGGLAGLGGAIMGGPAGSFGAQLGAKILGS